MSESITVHPRHAWILGLVADEGENRHGPHEPEHPDDNVNERPSDISPVAEERTDQG